MSNHRKTWTSVQKMEILNFKKDRGLAQASREFGVSSVSILNWEKKFDELGEAGLQKGAKTSLEQELKRLQRENLELKQINAEKDLALRIKDMLLKKTSLRKTIK